MIKLRGNELKTVHFQNVDLDKIFFNGVEVFSKAPPKPVYKWKTFWEGPNLRRDSFNLKSPVLQNTWFRYMFYTQNQARGHRLRISGYIYESSLTESVKFPFEVEIPNDIPQLQYVGDFDIELKGKKVKIPILSAPAPYDFATYIWLKLPEDYSTWEGDHTFVSVIQKCEYAEDTTYPKYHLQVVYKSKTAHDYLPMNSKEPTIFKLTTPVPLGCPIIFNEADFWVTHGSYETWDYYVGNYTRQPISPDSTLSLNNTEWLTIGDDSDNPTPKHLPILYCMPRNNDQTIILDASRDPYWRYEFNRWTIDTILPE